MNASSLLVDQIFTAGQAVNATGAAYYNINNWAKSGLIIPSVKKAKGSNTCRVYCFTDLLMLSVAQRLSTIGVGSQGLRIVVDFLRNRNNKCLSGVYLIVDEKRNVKEVKQLATAFESGTAFCVIDLGSIAETLIERASKVNKPARGKACKFALSAKDKML